MKKLDFVKQSELLQKEIQEFPALFILEQHRVRYMNRCQEVFRLSNGYQKFVELLKLKIFIFNFSYRLIALNPQRTALSYQEPENKNSIPVKASSPILISKLLVHLIELIHKYNILVCTVCETSSNNYDKDLKALGIYQLFDFHFNPDQISSIPDTDEINIYQAITDALKISPLKSMIIGYQSEVSKATDWCKISINGESGSEYFSLDTFIESNFSLHFSDEPYGKAMMPMNSSRSYRLRQRAKFIGNRKRRESIYKKELLIFRGNYIRIGSNVEIRYPDRFIVGDNCQINDNLTALNECQIIIGNNVMLAANIFMSTFYHNWKIGMLQEEVKCWDKGNTQLAPIIIENNVWIGPNTILEPGTLIGDNSIIAAGSLVKSGIYPAGSFIAGNPAKVVTNYSASLDFLRKAATFP